MNNTNSMLVAFRGENIRSFRDHFELSMLSSALSDEKAVHVHPWNDRGGTVGLLPTAGIFGANASGKSNVLEALDDMRSHVMSSFRRSSPNSTFFRRPFRLDAESRQRASRYEIEIVLNDVRTTYGYLLNDEEVLEEWAYRYPHGRGAMIFHRIKMEVAFGSTVGAKIRSAVPLLRKNALFLSIAGAVEIDDLDSLFEWFASNFKVATARTRNITSAETLAMLDDPDRSKQLLRLLQAADLGVAGVKTVEADPATKEKIQQVNRIFREPQSEEDLAELTDIPPNVQLTHQSNGEPIDFDFVEESFGTQAWFCLIGPATDALANGTVLLVDELDASLHPILVAQLIGLFQDRQSNPLGAQLIFNSHNPLILGDSISDRVLGRDQVWFSEKMNDGSTRLYSLAEFNPRKDESISRRYLAGRYGSIPLLAWSSFLSAVEDIADESDMSSVTI